MGHKFRSGCRNAGVHCRMEHAMPVEGPNALDSRPAASPLPEGRRVGRFEIRRLAGQGGMGRVYQAWDTLLERHVALKSVLPDAAGGEAALQRIRQEALALAQLSHPRICQVYDVLEAGAELFLAMEWVEGRTLDLAAGDLDTPARLRLLQEAAEGLAAAHAKGLVHRDFKPMNLMVDPEGHARILDFGLARREGPGPLRAIGAVASPATTQAMGALTEALTTDLPTGAYPTLALPVEGEGDSARATRVGTFEGSPPYAAPEQIRGGTVGPEADLWAFGVVAWELLLGEHPFPGEGIARMRHILANRRRPMKHLPLPRGIPALLEALLAPDAAARPTAAEAAARLQASLNPRRTWLWAVGLTGTALGIALGSWVLASRGVAADLIRAHPARVAVFPTENATGDRKLDALTRWVLPEMVGSGLRDSRHLRAVDLEDLLRAARRLRLDVSGGFSPEVQSRLAQAVGADLVLSTRLETKAPGTVALRYELRDAGGRMRFQAAPAAPRAAEDALPRLARETARSVRKAVDPLGGATGLDLAPLDASALDDYGEGKALMDGGDFKGAEPRLRRVAEAHPGFATAVLAYGRCLFRTGAQAPEPVLHWARMAARAEGDRREEVRSLHALAQRFSERGARERALSTLGEALRLAEQLEDAGLTGSLQNSLGTTLHEMGRLDEARVHYDAALGRFRGTGDRLAASRVLNNLAVMEKRLGRPKASQSLLLDSLAVTREMGDRWGEAVALNNLGDIALALGTEQEAERRYREAITLRAQIGDENGQIYSLVGMATVYQMRGDLDQAERQSRRALDLTRRLGLKPMEGLCLYNLGEFAREAGRYGAAKSAYRASFVLHRALEDTAMQAHALAGEAECLLRERPRRLAEAEHLLNRARQLHPETTPYLLRAQGWLESARGEGAARETFARALADARREAPEIVRELARLQP